MNKLDKMKIEEQNLNEPQKPQLNIADVIESTDFQNRLKAAIECGVDEDWCWNGEDEYRVDTFNADDATRYVTELLKEYFL